MHCHIDWHLSSGLAMVMIEAPEEFQKNTTVPKQLYDQCQYWNKPTSGNVVGLNSTTDFSGQPWGPFPLVMVSWPYVYARKCADTSRAGHPRRSALWLAALSPP